MLKKALSAGAIFAFLIGAAAAQDTGHFDVSLAFGGVLAQNSRNGTGTVAVEPTNSALLLAGFRFRFNRTNGIVLNFGRINDSQIYVLPPDNYRVQAKINEYSGAYVLSPFHFEKLDPFFFAGGGALRFSPGNSYIDGFQSPFGAAHQTSMAFLYGAGLDYPVWKRVGLRLQYRGLIFKEPNFHLQQLVTNSKGHMPELSLGIVFNF
ncbi:MAG TPA: outer membrane beta-barrel protein [Terriglobales bacterium]|nr:outer membrane beta-barrel protein [Terriglobales bacterium]